MIKRKILYKIYALICPITNEIRYIGYTYKKLNERLMEHCNPSKLKPNTHKNNWIKKLLSQKLKPQIIQIENTTFNNILNREIFFIKKYKGLGCNLTNSTDGGEGHLNHKMSKETVFKILETKRKNGTLNHSMETIEKIRQSKIGTKRSISAIEKTAASQRIPILQIDSNGEIIHEWKGIREASKFCGISHCGILRCLKNYQQSYKNYLWKYKI